MGGAGESDAPSANAATATDAALVIDVRGDGGGSLTVRVPNVGTFSCAQDCTLPMPTGSVVTMTATPRPYSAVRAWSEARCGTELSCTVTTSARSELSVEFQLKHDVAFATDVTYLPSQLPRPGDAANAECTRLAKAAGFHGTRWVAWLSADGQTPAREDDINAVDAFQHTGGWVRPDGSPVARSLSALLRGEILHPVVLSNSRGYVATGAWSGTGQDGRARVLDFTGVADCNGWTSDTADVAGAKVETTGVGKVWSDLFTSQCNQALSLICLGDDSDAEIALEPVSGRLAFLSATSFTPGGGLAAADALCQLEACEAGLTGGSDCQQAPGTQRTFLSYLHGAGQPAWQRFDLDGPTWVRPDGVPWLANAAELSRDAQAELTPPNVMLGPRYDAPGRMQLWVGDAGGVLTCSNWTSTSGNGAFTVYDMLHPAGLGNLYLPGLELFSDCSQPGQLLCLER
jgi:hypothetical protein